MARAAKLMVWDQLGVFFGVIGSGPAAAVFLNVPIDDQITGAFDAALEGDDAFADGSSADDGFYGRAGLVGGLGGAVEQRIVDVVGGKLFVDLVEMIEVIGGIGNQCANFSGGDIDDDDRAVHRVLFNDDPLLAPGHVLEDVFDLVLKSDIDGQLDGFSVLRFELGINLIMAQKSLDAPALPAKRQLAECFYATSADAVIGQILKQLVLLIGIVFHVGFVNRRHMPDHMAGDFAVRVVAVLAGPKNQAGELLDALFELVMSLGADVGDDDMRLGLLRHGNVEIIEVGIAFSAQTPVLVPGRGPRLIVLFDRLFVFVVPEITLSHFHAQADVGTDLFDLFQRLAGDLRQGQPHVRDVRLDALDLVVEHLLSSVLLGSAIIQTHPRVQARKRLIVQPLFIQIDSPRIPRGIDAPHVLGP